MIQVSCPHCHTTMQVPPSFAGQSGPCRNCQQILQIPVPTVAEPISYASQSQHPTSGSFPSYPPAAPLSQVSGTVFNSMSSHEGQFESLQTDLKVQHLEQLGQGGMGVVLRVRDQRLGRDAALKILKNDVSNKEMEKRFLREAKITAQLDHPSIPPVYEIGHNSSGDLFLLMRVIEGDTLQKKIRDYHDHGKDPKELRELLDCLVKVSQAVDYAHSQNIVHRDLKPQNIMVGQFGEVMVMDWGLAKDLSNQESDDFLDEQTRNMAEIEEGEGLTQVGAVMGTLGYMPPEQAGGEAIDQRADIFALGAILTEILTRKVPIAGQTNTNKMVTTIKGQIDRPADIDPSVPKELNALAGEALEADFADRLEKTKDFTENLQAYLAGNEVPLYQYSASERMKRKAQKYPGLLLGFPLVFTLFLATVFLGVQLRSAEKTAKQSTEDLAKTETALIDSKEKSLEKEKALEKNKKELEKNKEALKTTEKIVQLFKDAKESARKGQATSKIKSRVQKALTLSGRQFDDLLIAANIYKEAKLVNLAQYLLEEASGMKTEPHKALFQLHVLTVEEKQDLSLNSPYLQKILSLEHRGKDNIYILFANAHRLYEERRFKEAKALCSKIEGGNKRLAIVYYLRGLTKMGLREFDSALRDFDKVIKINPVIATAYYHRGVCKQQLGLSPEDAMLDFNRCIDLIPNHAPSYFCRAQINILGQDRKSVAEALSNLSKAIRYGPKFVSAYRMRARIRSKTGDSKGALADYDVVVKLDKGDAVSFYRRAGILKGYGRIQEASDSYKAAYTIKPDFYEPLYYKIKIDHTQSYKVAKVEDDVKLKELRQALRLKSKNSKLRSFRAALYIKLGQLDEALTDYNTIIKTNSPKASHYFNRAKLLAKLGRMKEASKDSKKAIKLDSGYAKKWNKELEKLSQFAKQEEEIKNLTQSLEGTKNDGKKLRRIAKLKTAQDKKQEAIQALTKAIAVDPESEQAYLECGKLLVDLRKYEKAIEFLTVAIERQKSNRKAYMERAEAYNGLRRYQSAIDDYSQVLSLKPTEKEALERRAELYLKTKTLRGALKDAESLIKLEPKRSKGYALRARARTRMKDEQGLEDFRKAVELDSKNWKLIREYGYTLADWGDYWSAIKTLKQLLSRFSEKMSKQDRERAEQFIGALKYKIDQ